MQIQRHQELDVGRQTSQLVVVGQRLRHGLDGRLQVGHHVDGVAAALFDQRRAELHHGVLAEMHVEVRLRRQYVDSSLFFNVKLLLCSKLTVGGNSIEERDRNCIFFAPQKEINCDNSKIAGQIFFFLQLCSRYHCVFCVCSLVLLFSILLLYQKKYNKHLVEAFDR